MAMKYKYNRVLSLCMPDCHNQTISSELLQTVYKDKQNIQKSQYDHMEQMDYWDVIGFGFQVCMRMFDACIENMFILLFEFLLIQNMSESDKAKLFARLRQIHPQQRNSQHPLGNLNSCLSSINTSLIREEDQKSKIYHALSSRKFNNTHQQFSLAYLNKSNYQEGKIEERFDANSKSIKKNEEKIQLINTKNVQTLKSQRKSYLRLKQAQQKSKYTNKTLSTLLDLNKEDNQRIKCRQCETIFKEKDKENDDLQRTIKNWKNKYNHLSEKYQDLKKKFQPYVNNTNFLTAIVQNLQQKNIICPIGEYSHQQKLNNTNNIHSQFQQTSKVNRWLIKQGREKDKVHQNQSYSLKGQIDNLKQDNKRLKNTLISKQNKIKGLQDQLRYYQANNSMRERLQMCRQQLYTYKLKYQQRCIEHQSVRKKLEEMKYKLTVLTSLIGCAIIFDLKEKENDKKHIKEFVNKIDKYQTITHNLLENNGFQYLKFYENIKNDQINLSNTAHQVLASTISQKAQAKVITKTVHQRKLYSPNYLILLGEQTVSTRTQHVIIKPLLFIKLRAILDSRYIDYRINEVHSYQFPDFCNSYLRHYDILESEKKPYMIVRQMSENQIKQINLDFFKCLLDQRIQDLPQVQIFREFLLGKWEEDQIYFYLMCRHKFAEGSELESFINSGDPSKLIKFDKAKRIVLKLTQFFGRNIQNFICYHINERKITKNNHEFLRLYYLLKVLLIIYRKVRIKKIEQFKQYFQGLLRLTKKDTLTFLQFSQLLRKNFDFLNRSQICQMFKQSYSLYESQKSQPNFYQCFAAVSLPSIFLQQLIRLDKQIQLDCMNSEQMMAFQYRPNSPKKPSLKSTKFNEKTFSNSHSQQNFSRRQSIFKNKIKSNQLNQLWPDSVYSLGNQGLNRQYMQLSRSSSYEATRVKIQTINFLNKLVLAHYIRQNIHLGGKEDLGCILDEGIFNLIQYLNKIQKRKIEYENGINLASKKIGRFFKNKIYQFYNEMLQDINNIKPKIPNTASPGKKQQPKKNKRYVKQKIRASKVFQSFKLN